MAVTDVLTLDEFVDLYKILEIPQSTSETEVRERVNKLYLEAQRNLDHHNFRKRFYYQQLYEVHLPQAHQLLLNAPQRAEYDRYLDCFNKGLPFPADLAGTRNDSTSGELGRSEQIETDMLPTFDSSVANAAPPATSVTQTSAKTSDAKVPARPAAPASRPARSTASPAEKASPGDAAASLAAQVAKRKAQVIMDASEVERRRDYKRRELIKGELVASGLWWGWGAGAGCFIVVAALLFFALNQMKMTANNALSGGLLIAVVIAALIGRYALREARRRVIVVLSKMPYDELLRRCSR